jgi:Nif-specific regulatory protein
VYQHLPQGTAGLKGLPPIICRLIHEQDILFDVAQMLQAGGDLRIALGTALEKMGETLGLRRGVLRILNRATGERVVEVSCGKLPGECGEKVEQGLVKIEERVMAECVGVVLPDLQHPERPLLSTELGAAADRDFCPGAVAWICVPVAHQKEVLGTLSAAGSGSGRVALESDLRLLVMVAQLIAQSVRSRQQAQEQIEYLRQENDRLQGQIKKHFVPDNMIGNSRAMQTVYHSIEQVAGSTTTVLIRGESGVGKELVAHAIHSRSPRSGRAFVKVNCAALPDSIVESELFGHEKGAFTGAIAMRKGRFELAHGGTIFLDEIGELPLQTQAKLLRILQEREFERVGGVQTLACDVRVIAATNRPLEKFVEEDKFRQDLYYRLNVFPIYVPALRERKTDLLQLADFFVEKYNQANGKKVRRISTPAIDMLLSYHWPGNVRELENCIERAVLLADADGIHGHHLPPTLQMPTEDSGSGQGTLHDAVAAFEREMVLDALKAHQGNMAAAARQLGISERIMGLRVRKYQVQPKKFRD